MRSHCPNAQARSHREIQDVRKLPVRLVAALAVVDQLCAGRLRRAHLGRCCHRVLHLWRAGRLFPIFVVGCIAAWRQLRAPSAGQVQTMLDQAQAMPWASSRRRHAPGQGYGVNARHQPGP